MTRPVALRDHLDAPARIDTGGKRTLAWPAPLMPKRLTKRRAFLVGSCAALLLAGGLARAATVKGVVRLPEGARSTRLYLGYWRLENGNVPVQSAGGAKAETAVVLFGVN